MVLHLKSLPPALAPQPPKKHKPAARPRASRKRKAKLPGPPESAIVKDVLLYLATVPGRFWRANAGGFRAGGHLYRLAPVGTADVIGVLEGGRFLACELKRPGGGKLRPSQAAWQAEMRALGALVISEARSTRDVFDALITAGLVVPAPDVRLL